MLKKETKIIKEFIREKDIVFWIIYVAAITIGIGLVADVSVFLTD